MEKPEENLAKNIKNIKSITQIPDFKSFCDEITKLYYECEDLDGGANASYIPQLERYAPKLFTVSVCTVDGQRFTIGDKGMFYFKIFKNSRKFENSPNV